MENDNINFSGSINPHRQYWGYVFRKICNFISKHKKLSWSIIIILILFILTYLGYVNYTPEFNSFIGTFKIKEVNTNVGENTVNSNSNKLDRSIFDLAWETINGKLTSQEKVNLITGISGLETKKETGNIEDIGTDGLAFLIKGNDSDGHTGILRCNFSQNWKQRLSLLKKGDALNFKGTVSMYDLSQSWIILKNCEISE